MGRISSTLTLLSERLYRERGEIIMYHFLLRKQVEASRKEAEKDGVHVPQTVEEYTAIVQKQSKKQQQTSVSDMDDMLEYDDYLESSEEEEEEEEEEPEDDDDIKGSDDNYHDADSGMS